jgi:hypothetical protein
MATSERPWAGTSNPQAAEQAEKSAGPDRWVYVLLALAAGLCWTGALALLLLANLEAETNPLAPQRIFFYVLVLAAGVLTFAPVEYAMKLRGLGLQGVIGSAVLLYTLAFVPPPNDWLLSLPDIPVYALLLGALFYTTSAVVLPFVYAAGQRIFKNRARRLDVRRARRQAYEIGVLVTCIAALAALGVLTWVSILLLLLVLVTAELLFLARIEVQRR